MSEVCLEGTPSDCMSQRGHLVTIDIIYALMLENAILIFMRIYNFVNNYYLIINLCLNCENCRPRRHRYQHLYQSSCLLPVWPRKTESVWFYFPWSDCQTWCGKMRPQTLSVMFSGAKRLVLVPIVNIYYEFKNPTVSFLRHGGLGGQTRPMPQVSFWVSRIWKFDILS